MPSYSSPSSLLLLLLASASNTGWAQTQVQQLGSSGKFRISNDNGASDPNAVTVEVDSVEEIVSSGSTDHLTNNMANQAFTVSSAVNTTVGNGVAASKVTFETTLTTNGGSSVTYGTLQLDTYIMQESGTVATDAETFDVAENDVKFNILLSSWTFDTLSEFVDVALIIKGKSSESDLPEETEKNYDLGGNVPLLLSGRVTVDGTDGNVDGISSLHQDWQQVYL